LHSQLGQPFILGANRPNSFDSPGLSKYCQEAANVTGLSRTSLEQSHAGKAIACMQADIGDLIFFDSPVAHVGTFSSDVCIIHAFDEEKPAVEYPNIFSR
jgi:cell wall-associated NlpC family hydrolase